MDAIYILSAGRVLTTNVFQINLGQHLFSATLQVRLGSCLSLLSKWITSKSYYAHFIACLWEGLIYEWEHTLLAPSLPCIQLTAVFHTQLLLTSLLYSIVAPAIISPRLKAPGRSLSPTRLAQRIQPQDLGL